MIRLLDNFCPHEKLFCDESVYICAWLFVIVKCCVSSASITLEHTQWDRPSLIPSTRKHTHTQRPIEQREKASLYKMHLTLLMSHCQLLIHLVIFTDNNNAFVVYTRAIAIFYAPRRISHRILYREMKISTAPQYIRVNYIFTNINSLYTVRVKQGEPLARAISRFFINHNNYCSPARDAYTYVPFTTLQLSG